MCLSTVVLNHKESALELNKHIGLPFGNLVLNAIKYISCTKGRKQIEGVLVNCKDLKERNWQEAAENHTTRSLRMRSLHDI